MPWITIAALTDCRPGQALLVEIAGKSLAVFHQPEGIFVLDNRCPHRDAPLHEGVCRDGFVICPWHNARFDLRTGAHHNPPATTGVRAYSVQIVGETIQVELD